jgi:hypothetical protein
MVEKVALDIGEDAEIDLFTREDNKLEEVRRFLFGSSEDRRVTVLERIRLADDMVRIWGYNERIE